MNNDPLVTSYLETHPAAAASSLHQVTTTELTEFLTMISPPVASSVLTHMMPTVAADVLDRLEDELAAEILSRMPNEAAVLTMRSLNRNRQNALYSKMPQNAVLRLRLQMRYPEALVGSLVDPDSVTLRPDQRVSSALLLLREGGQRISQQIYLIDNERHLHGYVDIKNLIVTRERTTLSRIMKKVPLVLNVRAPLHSAEDLDVWLDFDSLPAVDRHGTFQGVLRRDALMREDHSLLTSISSEKEFTRTRTALSDILWLIVSSMLAPRDKKEAR
ncbi:MAG: CBS domain-containing protein [Candidatus Thiodiazotropha taylori]|nr:hypothetical protein [Candidatus Thiodiazotropha taylori]